MRRIPCAGHRTLTPDSPGRPPFAGSLALSSTPMSKMRDKLWRRHLDRVTLRCCPTNL